MDGLFYPDRTPHPGAKQIKNCYRPVRAKVLSHNGKKITVSFKNHRYFTDVNLRVKWQALDVNESSKGEFELQLKPQEEKELSLDVTKSFDAVIFEYFENGKEIAFEQIDFNTT